MRQGSTPTEIFTTDIDLATVKTLWLSFEQGNIKFTKELSDITILPETEHKKFSVTLTQEETLSLSHMLKVNIQLRVLTYDGVAMVSQIISRDVGRVIKGGIIS